jgi:RND family efflux transporter MFP subunit
MSRISRSHLWIVILVLSLPWLASCGGGPKEAVPYHCPMHPTYTADGPGECPICGMDLVPIPKESPDTTHAAMKHEDTSHGAVPGYSTVHASPEGVSLAGVRTAPAVRGPLSRTVRAVGNVVADETRAHEVHTRISGWVERLLVDFTGQFVGKGDPLLEIYSPELVASQDEYVRARRAVERFAQSSLPEVREGADELVMSARERLLSFDVPAKLLDRLDAGAEAQRTVTLDAPASGFVTTKDVFAGSRVDPGMTLFTISDLSRIWVEAEAYEQEAPLIRLGQAAEITLPYDPAFKSTGRVSYVYPTLDVATRTIRVRVELANPDFTLKPGMYANVELSLESADGVLIPEDAVLDSGLRQVVFVETGERVFEPREVDLGVRSDGQVLVLAGVSEGERVVVGANFLLDSESRLRSAIGAAGDASSGSMPGMEMGAGEK